MPVQKANLSLLASQAKHASIKSKLIQTKAQLSARQGLTQLTQLLRAGFI
jgi:hypothetical protein